MSTECQDSGALSVSLWKHGLVTSLSATVLVPSCKNRPVLLSRAEPQRDPAQSSSVLSTFNFGRLAYIWRVISLMQLASHRMAGVISSWQQCKYRCVLLANAWQSVTYWCQKLEVGPHEDLRSEVETSLKTSIWLFSYSNEMACCCHYVADCAFSALTLLVGVRKSIWSVKNWVMWSLCLEWGADCLHNGPADAIASQNPIISCLI